MGGSEVMGQQYCDGLAGRVDIAHRSDSSRSKLHAYSYMPAQPVTWTDSILLTCNVLQPATNVRKLL